MRLYVKIGTMPAQYMIARLPRRRKNGPWVGDRFEIREEEHGSKYEQVVCSDIKRLGEGPTDPLLHYLERL